ncbi:MAG: DMT family transporter [Hyphomicrobiales bacterium]
MAEHVAIKREMGPVQWALFLSLGFIWGLSFFFNALALKFLDPIAIVALRMVIATVALWGVAFAMGLKVPSEPERWRDLAVMGFLNNVVPFTLIVWAQKGIPSGLASILNATTPFFVLIVANYTTRDEPLTANRLAGVVVGLVGVAIMVGLDALHAAGTHIFHQIGSLAAALCYGFAAPWGRRLAVNPPIVTAAGQTLCSAIVLSVAAAVTGEFAPLGSLTWADVGVLLALGLACTAVAYVLYFSILKSAGAGNVSLVTFIVPVSAILMGVLVLHETLLPRHLFGMLAIGAGLALIDGRVLRPFYSRS